MGGRHLILMPMGTKLGRNEQANDFPQENNLFSCFWVKGFAAFKKNVSVAYAWEPVIIKAARKPVVSGRIVMRDWIKESITLQRGLTGAKPEAVCHWAFELLGAEAGDELVDLFPGTGAVSRAWGTWQERVSQLELLSAE